MFKKHKMDLCPLGKDPHMSIDTSVIPIPIQV